MGISVRIPLPLRDVAKGRTECLAAGSSVREVIDSLDSEFPGMRERLVDVEGKLRPSVSLFLNDEDVRYRGGLDSAVRDGDRLWLVPAIAGGRS